MENRSGEQTSEQSQQASAQSTNMLLPPTTEKLAEFAASLPQMRQKRKATEPFAMVEEAPARRTQAPQSTGIHNQRFLAITPVDQIHPVLPALSGSNQELSTTDASPSHDRIQPKKSALSNNTDLREQLREDVRKEFELRYDSKLAKRTGELETFWRRKREERTKEVENYWKQKLTEAFSKDKDEITRELHEEIEKLKARLEKGPGLIKAAEERGRRQGELDGFNKLSLNPELKPSQDRQNFEFLMKEKNKEIAEVKTARDNWFRDARKYSQETNAKLQEQNQQIQQLQAKVQNPPPQLPPAPDNTEALIAAGRELQNRFDNQMQEFVSLQEKCNNQAIDLANLTARLADMSQESSIRDQLVDAQSAELREFSAELDKKTKEVSILRRESDQKSVELNDSSKDLGEKTWEISTLREKCQKESKELEENRRQVKAQSEEIASLLTRHSDSESSNKSKDRKIASLRELLDSLSLPQSNRSDQEEIKLLKEQLAEIQSLHHEAMSENASLRDRQAGSELEDLQPSPEMGNAALIEADAELVRAMLEKEREKIEAENSRRENRLNATLERVEKTERDKRQMLIEELDRKDSALYDAQKRVRDLEQQLLASSLSHSSQSPSQESPISTHPSASIFPAPPLPLAAAAPSPSFRWSHLLACRSLFIVLLIFILPLFASFIHSLANPGSEFEPVGLTSRDDRLQWEAWELAARERDEGVPTYEESWRRTQEVGQMGDWGAQ